MDARIQRWGSGLAVRIPTSLAQQAGLEENAPVTLSVVTGKLLLEPVASRTFALDELLAGVTETKGQAEIPTGPAAGQEAWSARPSARRLLRRSGPSVRPISLSFRDD